MEMRVKKSFAAVACRLKIKIVYIKSYQKKPKVHRHRRFL
jgi:hypothetical protein